MASKSGAVTLRGRFSPGTPVELVKVKDESVLRSEGGEVVGSGVVDADGAVSLSGLAPGERGFIRGNNDGFPLEVRVTARESSDDGVFAQAPVGRNRTRLSDGSFADEAPEQEDPGFGGVGPAPGQHQVPKGVVQRSDTPRGTAHPVDPSEAAPYPRQEDVEDGTVQRSATETGKAEPLTEVTHPAQADVKDGTLQRSDTPEGVATPIPADDAVEAQRVREAAETVAVKAATVKPAASNKRAAERPAKKAAAKTAAKSNPNKEK